MDDNIHIVLITDRNYLNFVFITVASILTYHKTGNIVFHIIHSGCTTDDFKPMDTLRALGDFELDMYEIDREKFTQEWGTKAPNWWRLAMHEIYPQLDKVLYLDCDLTLLDDVQKLWDIDMQGHMLAGVADRCGRTIAEQVGLRDATRYINNGVLLMNLKKLRDTNASLLMHETIKKFNYEELTYWEQTIQNICFQDDILMLPPRWNIINSFYRHVPLKGMFTAEQVIEAIKNPGIAHFTGHHKPWQLFNSNHHVYAQCFWYFVQRAPVPASLKFKMKLKKLLFGRFRDSKEKRPWDKSIIRHDWD